MYIGEYKNQVVVQCVIHDLSSIYMIFYCKYAGVISIVVCQGQGIISLLECNNLGGKWKEE